MESSEARAIRFIELAILAKEGALAVGGVPFTSAIESELARRTLAERAVAEATLLLQYVPLNPACGWCDRPITVAQLTREVNGRLYHDNGDDLTCAQLFEDECAGYDAEVHAR